MACSRWLLLLPAIAGAVGCQGGETANPAPATPAPIAVAKPSASLVAAPTTIQPSELALVHNRGEVTVGMAPEGAFKVFADLRTDGFESHDLPPGFADPYTARSWEDSQRGFGVILYNGVVAAAMYQDQKMTPPDLFAYVKEYRSRLSDMPPRYVSGNKVDYWFWELGDQRLMICGYRAALNEVRMTACVGVDNVLDALGASYEQAKQDESTIDDFPTPGKIGRRPPGSAK